MGQRFVRPTLHVVSDGSEWPDLPQVDNLIRYQTEGGWGPYRITNAVFHNFRSDFIAIQDGDDLSRPDRLWRQLQTLKYHRAEMISSAAVNFLDWESTEDPGLQNRMKIEPVIRPGTIYASTPRGRLVNNTRTMKRDMFERLNGFGGQFCTGDFQLDNRARFAGVRIVDDQTIQADRRLHSSSLTGGSFKIGTKQRTEDMGRCMLAVTKMTDSPTEDTARSLGSLDRAEKLIPI